MSASAETIEPQPITVLPARQAAASSPATQGMGTASAEIAKLDNFGTVAEMKNFAAELIKTGLVPKSLKTPEAVVGVVLMGKELGFGAMTALSNIHSVDNRPTLSVHAIGAKLHQKGLITKTIKDSEPEYNKEGELIDLVTTIRYYQPFHGTVVTEDVTLKWSDAEKAGWTGKPTWAKMPGIMLWNRCYAIGARRVAPDALLGMYEVSEWADAKNVSYKLDENNEPVPLDHEPEWLR